MNTVVKIISVILIVAIALGLVAFLYFFINNGQRNFYVMYANKTITGSSEGAELPKKAYSYFTVGTLTGQPIDYTVGIYLRTDDISDFEYTLDGSSAEFKRTFADYDCTELFKITKSEEGFYLYYDFTLESLVQSKYPDMVVSNIPEMEFWENAFEMRITDSVEKSVTVFRFR